MGKLEDKLSASVKSGKARGASLAKAMPPTRKPAAPARPAATVAAVSAVSAVQGVEPDRSLHPRRIWPD